MDINSVAVSIEMFICEDLLRKSEKFVPVHWGGYFQALGQYQGEIGCKKELVKKFLRRINEIKNGNASVTDFNWNTMQKLLDQIRETASLLE